ncbi:MAG TPA: aminotransferase class I/II-fold pyridoxal phosphate-dependent enzyme [Flavitalea sp.]|nr:aminotransferase class I/II-fold pyridoxal phosphate-dependent enzyme [Flavitalea sp.]
MITAAKRLEGIDEYYFSQKLREIESLNKAGKNVINLGIGSPDRPPHPDVIRVLQEESINPNVHGYQGYKGIPALRNAFAQWYETWYGVSLDPDTEILPLIGSKEGIMHICMTYLNTGDPVLVPNPGYPTYRSAVKLAGGTCLDYDLTEENSWFPDFDHLDQVVTIANRPIKLMFVNYPHMPTGKLPTSELFERIVSFGRKHNILICHDNPYSFILNEYPMSLLSVDGSKDTVIELNSLSKAQNMAGWRVGVLAGSKERIEEVLRFKSNMDSGMFLPIQSAAVKALTLGEDWYNQLNAVYKSRRTVVYELLNLLNCEFDTEQAGLFMWAKVNKQYKNGYQLSDELLNKANVFITPGGIFGSAGEAYVRVSLCSTEEKLRESISRIKVVSQGLGMVSCEL